MSETVTSQLQEYVDNLWIVDTHEHLPSEEERLRGPSDPLAALFLHYASCDVVSAGLRPEDLARCRDASTPLVERWALFEPYWKRAANTGYARSLLHAISDLYGIQGLDATTIAPLAEAMEDRRRPGLYRWVLKERSRIAVSILDSNPAADPEFFVSVVRFDDFLAPTGLEGLRALERRSGVSIHGLGDLELALETQFQNEREKGIVGLKSGLAYVRPLDYRKPDRPDAERAVHRLLAGDPEYRWWGDRTLSPAAMRPLCDHMMHRLLRLAEESDLPFQIHTGIQEGNGNDIRNSDPKLLIPLFQEYPRVKFDIFHSGYPFLSDLTVMAKNFPNVFIDMCWMHIVSPAAARRALAEYLDAVPANKILGFGGDYCFVEGVYGHQKIARRNVATVLAEKVCDGHCTLAEAEEMAVRLLQRNPIELFGLTREIPGE